MMRYGNAWDQQRVRVDRRHRHREREKQRKAVQKAKEKINQKDELKWEKQGQATLMKWLSNSGDREENPDRDKS
jgi:hypothetical protein